MKPYRIRIKWRCEFCEMGVYNRKLAWRIIKTMSRKDMKEMLKQIKQQIKVTSESRVFRTWIPKGKEIKITMKLKLEKEND